MEFLEFSIDAIFIFKIEIRKKRKVTNLWYDE